MDQLYESKISVKRWIVYDIFGNIGWIAYFICAGKLWKAGNASFWMFLPVVLMLVGLVELISERIAKLSYVLPKIRLYRGFGALALGGVCGAGYGAVCLCTGLSVLHFGLLCGGVLCAIFSWLLFREYHLVG